MWISSSQSRMRLGMIFFLNLGARGQGTQLPKSTLLPVHNDHTPLTTHHSPLICPALGKTTQNVLPAPSTLSTERRPPWTSSPMCLARGGPSPVPEGSKWVFF